MKFHLPLTLLLTLMSTFSAQAIEIPDNYEHIDLLDYSDLDDYTSNTVDDKYVFLLQNNLKFTPTTNETWADSTPLVSGGNLIFTTVEGNTPSALSFSSGSSSVFSETEHLTFDTLSNLAFSGQSNSAIDLHSYGKL